MKVTGRKAEVLRALQAARGWWVPGFELATADCGGSEGLRRLRELREMGYDIEKRKVHPTHKYFSYRLVRLADIYGIESRP
jgi:biotin operon repressor